MSALVAVLADPAFMSGRSPVTIYNYKVALARWARCAQVVDVEHVTLERAVAFVSARLGQVQVQSVSVEYMALLAVMDHLERAGLVDAELLRRLRRAAPALPRKGQFSAPFMTREELAAFCAGADERTAFLARLACLTGLRAGELARLRWVDVQLERRVIRVGRGKTGGRLVSLCAPAIELLRPRVAVRPAATPGRPADTAVTREAEVLEVLRGGPVDGDELVERLARGDAFWKGRRTYARQIARALRKRLGDALLGEPGVYGVADPALLEKRLKSAAWMRSHHGRRSGAVGARASSSDHVFGGVGPRRLQEWVRDARAVSGVRASITLFRHTRASWLLQAGVPLERIAKQLGNSLMVCARHYASLADGYDPMLERGAC